MELQFGAGLIRESPLGECLEAFLAVQHRRIPQRRQRKTADVRHHLLDGDGILSVRGELRNVGRDRTRGVEQTVGDQLPQHPRDDRAARRLQDISRRRGGIAEGLERVLPPVNVDGDLGGRQCAVLDLQPAPVDQHGQAPRIGHSVCHSCHLSSKWSCSSCIHRKVESGIWRRVERRRSWLTGIRCTASATSSWSPPTGRSGSCRLNRPDHLNGANRPMHQSMARVWDHLGRDAGARAVVITGSGSTFSAGGDFGYMQENIDDEAMRRQTIDEGRSIIRGMVRCPLPVIAAVNGPAVGLGCSIALLCDLVLMSEDSFLADPHLRMGLVPGDGGMVWPALTGLSRAKEYLFLGVADPAGAGRRVRTGESSRGSGRADARGDGSGAPIGADASGGAAAHQVCAQRLSRRSTGWGVRTGIDGRAGQHGLPRAPRRRGEGAEKS